MGTSAHRSLLAEKLAQAVYRGAEGLCAQELCQRLNEGICQLNGRGYRPNGLRS
jgi:hypothetical protein